MSEATPATKPIPMINGDILATGRRKTAVARIRLRAGKGKITVNGRELAKFFPNEKDRNSLLAPLVQTGKQNDVDVTVRVTGGGPTGQADSCKLGIARALKKFDETTEPTLRDAGMLTRDSRMKERKHYGLRGARRGTQFSKR